jgi:microcystin-dependent protein
MTIRTLVHSAALTGLVAAIPVQALACGTDAYIGQVCLMAGSYCPNNTAEAQGQMMAINSYQALFSLLGCTYGGDGACRTNFALPDLRGRVPVGWGQGPGLSAHAMGQTFGQEGVTQTLAMLPAHTHAATFVPAGGGTPGGNVQFKARQAAGTTDAPSTGAMLGQSSTTSGEQVNVYLDPAITSGSDVALGGVSGGGGTPSGGTVTVEATGGGAALPTVPPSIALRYCIVLNGIYPSRP